MIEKMSNYIVNNLLIDDEMVDTNHKEIMLFGVTRILEDIPKFTSILFICYLLNTLNELFVVLMVTLCYKTFIGGAHAKTNLQCFIVSSIYFILPIMLAKYLNYNLSILYIIFLFTILFCIYTIIKIAPADTEEIPILNKNRRLKMKYYAAISLILISIITFVYFKDIVYIKLIVYTLFLVNLFSTPVIYKLLGCKLGKDSDEYKNYY